MDNPFESATQKVETLFAELVGPERARRLRADVPSSATTLVTQALAESRDLLLADQIAFNVTDWQADAAFLVAIHLFPERFTPEEIAAGVESLLIHVPSHALTAARLSGHEAADLSDEH